MGDANPICTLRDYSRPSHEGYRNAIKLPEGNNVVPLQPNTVMLVQNECSFHGFRSEDPIQHLKDFLRIVDSIDLNEEGSLDYENPDLEQLLGVTECKVGTLMEKVISLMGRSESIFRMSNNMMHQLPLDPSRQEAFEDLMMNFILDQEERGNRTKKIEKITRYPDTEDLEPLNGHKFSEALTEKESFHTPKFVLPKSLGVKYIRTVFPVLPSFKVYTLPVTYLKEVEDTIGIPVDVETLDHTKLEDFGLDTYSHDLFLSSREIPSFDEP
ncbi:hypothetical protein Tco_0397847 [Tanacetum coccineum]